jgi:hypothetical protein
MLGTYVRSAVSGMLMGLGLLTSMGASATVNDPEYIKLYPVADGGDQTSVQICGVGDCSDNTLDMLVSTVSIQPAGSGVRDTFLRLQTKNANVTTESGYNTNGPYPLEDVNGAKDTNAGNKDTFNNAVLISDLLIVEHNGIEYYQILLDVNEPGGDQEFIRLDEFEVHTTTNGDLSGFQGFGDASTPNPSFIYPSYIAKRFDMDAWGQEGLGGVTLNSMQDGGGKNGSGDEDYVFELPVALFSVEDKYLHVAVTFGEAGCKKESTEGCSTDPAVIAESGFEEFAAVLGPNPEGDFDVPVPGTALLLGLGMALMYRRRRPVAS